MHIGRSRSVPVNDKEASLKGMDSFFRVIPSTPRVKEGDVFSNASEAVNTGKVISSWFIRLLFIHSKSNLLTYLNRNM